MSYRRPRTAWNRTPLLRGRSIHPEVPLDGINPEVDAMTKRRKQQRAAITRVSANAAKRKPFLDFLLTPSREGEEE